VKSLRYKQLTISLFVGIILLLAICLAHSFSYSYAQQQQEQFSPPAYVKITSPVTGQKVPVGNLTISGTSSDRATSDCTVYADWDDVKPYQRVLSNGSTGAKDDYSKWYFTYTPAYHAIINGTNELTAKISCLDSPLNQTKWYSVNVTGVVPITTTNTTIGNQTQANLTAATTASNASGPTYFVFPQPATKIKVYEKSYHTTNDGANSNPQGPTALFASIHVAKDPIVRGNTQTISVTVSDPKTHGKIKGAHVDGTVHYTTTTTKTFAALTDKNGQIAPFSWIIGPNSNTGKFTVEIKVTANGYKTTSESSSFKVISGSPPPPEPPTTPNQGKLLLSINVAKDPIIRGNKQTISVTVSDDKSHNKFKGAHVDGTVNYATAHTETFSGTTGKDGKISHSWTISGHANPGKFGIEIQVSAVGYKTASKTSSFTVESKTSSSQPTNNIKSLHTQPEATEKDNSDNDTSGGKGEETNTVAKDNNNNNNNGIASADTKDKNKDADQNSNTDTDKASKIVTATGVDTKKDGNSKVDAKPEDQDKGNVLDDHNDKKKKDDKSKATDDSDTHDKVKSKPESNNHDDNGGDKIKTTHDHKKSTDKKPDKKPKEDPDKK
jgi:hypothetical protein